MITLWLFFFIRIGQHESQIYVCAVDVGSLQPSWLSLPVFRFLLRPHSHCCLLTHPFTQLSTGLHHHPGLSPTPTPTHPWPSLLLFDALSLAHSPPMLAPTLQFIHMLLNDSQILLQNALETLPKVSCFQLTSTHIHLHLSICLSIMQQPR